MEHKNNNTKENKATALHNTTGNIKKKVIEHIKKENIKPQPKAYFKIKNILFWVLLSVSIIIGILATGMLFYFKKTLEDYFFTDLRFQNKLQFLSISVPVFWIVSLILSLYGIVKGYRNTKNGYKIPNFILIILISSLLLIIGTHNTITTLLEKMDRRFHFLPRYMKIRARNEQNWMSPHRGLIAGRIISINKETHTITITLLNKEQWDIHISDIQHFSDKFYHCRKQPEKNHQSFTQKQQRTQQHCNATKKDTYHSSTILDILATILIDKETVFIRAEGQVIGDLQFKAEKLFPAFYNQPYDHPDDIGFPCHTKPHPRNKEPPLYCN